MIIKNGKRIDGCTDTLPIGTVQPFLGLTPPKGYLLCQGQLVSKVEYPELYNICGSTFGTETDTHFYLPDLRGRTIAGYHSGDDTFNILGLSLGEKKHRLTELESGIREHTHAMPLGREAGVGAHEDVAVRGIPSSADPEFRTGRVTGINLDLPRDYGSPFLTGTNTANAMESHNNIQPTMVLNWIVKAVMLIPEYFIVENTLTSTSTGNALSAAQGKVLNAKIDACYPITGGKLNGFIEVEDGYPHLILRSRELLYNSTPSYTQYPCVLWTDKNNMPMGRLEMIASADGSRYMSLYSIAPGYSDSGNFFKIGWNAKGEAVSTLDGDLAIQRGLTLGGSMTVPQGFYRDYEWTFNMYLEAAEEWYDTGIMGHMVSEGAYLITAYIGSYAANAQFSEGFAGIAWIYSSTTNSTDAHEIPMSRSGHASNGHDIRFRLARTSNGGYVRLQMADSRAWSGEGEVRIKMKKLI